MPLAGIVNATEKTLLSKALLEAGHPIKTPGRMVQECGVGLVPISVAANGDLAFAAPEAMLTSWEHPGLAAALNSEAFDMQQAVTIVDMGIRGLLVEQGALTEDPVDGTLTV